VRSPKRGEEIFVTKKKHFEDYRLKFVDLKARLAQVEWMG
jgi:hypothetical protein